MKNNNFSLAIYLFILGFVQIVINNSSSLYFDLLGVSLVVLILSGNYNLISLLLISLIADLIGHWYLGTHLVAAISLTFISKSITNYFNISTFLHKSITLIIFSAGFFAIIFIIDLIVHNAVINIKSLFIEIFIITPIILKLLERLLIVQNRDIIL